MATGQDPSGAPSTLPGCTPAGVDTVGQQGSRLGSSAELFAEVPAAYIVDVLTELAPRLIAGINCTSITHFDAPDDLSSLPKRQPCVFNPLNRAAEAPLPPDCFFALTFPPSPSYPSRLLVPAHSLVYTLLDSPLFSLVAPPSALSTRSEIDSSLDLDLPVFGPFELPSYRAFADLHTYVYSRSSAQLLRRLISFPNVNLNHVSYSEPPSPPPSPTFGHRSAACQTAAPSSTLPPSTYRTVNERQLKRIHELRRTGVILQTSDEKFWFTLRRAHEVVSNR